MLYTVRNCLARRCPNFGGVLFPGWSSLDIRDTLAGMTYEVCRLVVLRI